MELYQIRSFIAVAEALNLTRAARATHQSPSAVSTQIKALESDLGVILFRRSPRGMALTPEGESLLSSARTLDRAARDMIRQAGRLHRTLSGNLNIGINTDPGYLNLSGLSRKMTDALPNITLTYIETQTFSTPSLLKSGDIDLGFHFGNFKDPDLFSYVLSTSRIRVVLPAAMGPAHKKASLADLAGLPWVWTRHACPFHIVFQQRLDREGLTLTATADAVDENIVEELVKSGTGAALMREHQAAPLVKQGIAVYWEGPDAVPDPGSEIPLGLACLDRRKAAPVLAAFFKAIRSFHHLPDKG